MKKNWILRVLALLLVLTLVPMCAVRSLVFPGAQPGGCSPDTKYGHTEQYTAFTMQDGTVLRGWLFNRGPNAPLVVMYGGNSINAGDFSDYADEDTTRSYLLVNYRGYGSSEGEPSEKDIVADSCAVLDQAKEKLGKPSATTLVGFSIGTGVAMQVAAAKNPDKLVLICPFDSLVNVACDFIPAVPNAVVIDKFISTDYAPKITCDVAILRADQDEIVLPPRTDALRESFNRPVTEKTFHATHNTIFNAEGFHDAFFSELR